MPNVYDFDKTIVYPDSGAAFFGFCLRRHPRLLRYLPGLCLELLRFALRSKRPAPFKAEYYGFLRGLPDWEEEVRLFWETKADALLKPWYLTQKRPDDIIVSCSGEYLLGPLCQRLGVRLVGTRVNTATGRLESFSCYGEEKVRRLRQALGAAENGDALIDEFYSDSLSDAHLAALARRAFLVKGDARGPWPGMEHDGDSAL